MLRIRQISKFHISLHFYAITASFTLKRSMLSYGRVPEAERKCYPSSRERHAVDLSSQWHKTFRSLFHEKGRHCKCSNWETLQRKSWNKKFMRNLGRPLFLLHPPLVSICVMCFYILRNNSPSFLKEPTTLFYISPCSDIISFREARLLFFLLFSAFSSFIWVKSSNLWCFLASVSS